MDNTVYFYNIQEIYKLWNYEITHKISLANSKVDGIKMYGKNEKDFFIQSIDGIGHYNGQTLVTLFTINENFGIIDGIVFENDVFFIGFFKDSFKFFLIHGILQDKINES